LTGKIDSIYKNTNQSSIRYLYDPMGNRIGKRERTATGVTSTWYVRDAKARQCLDLLFQQDLAKSVPIFYIGSNAMATYKQPTPTALSLQEFSLYGSSRLGVSNANLAVYPRVYDAGNEIVQQPPIDLPIGLKQYELTNHLGNVLSTISDFKVPVDIGNNGSTDYFTATVISQQSYYPFGMLMPERQFSVTNGNYRFGFNGKENDNEVKGIGNQQDYGMRIYDPRLGRFFAVDPIAKDYPWYSPYHFAGCNPIWYIDIDGLEPGIRNMTRAERQESFGPIDPVFVNDPVWSGINGTNSTVLLRTRNITTGLWTNAIVVAGTAGSTTITIVRHDHGDGLSKSYSKNVTTIKITVIPFNPNTDNYTNPVQANTDITAIATNLAANPASNVTIVGQSNLPVGSMVGTAASPVSIGGVVMPGGALIDNVAVGRAAAIQGGLNAAGAPAAQVSVAAPLFSQPTTSTTIAVEESNTINLPP